MNIDKLIVTHGLICFGFDGCIGMIAQQKAYDKLVEMYSDDPTPAWAVWDIMKEMGNMMFNRALFISICEKDERIKELFK